ENLPGEGNAMLATHFHLVSRDRPHGVFSIDLRPFRLSKLARSHKDMRRQSKREGCDFVARISLDGAKKRASFLTGRDRRVVLHLWNRERAAQVGSDIALSPCGGDCVTEDPADYASHAPGTLVPTIGFDFAKHGQD